MNNNTNESKADNFITTIKFLTSTLSMDVDTKKQLFCGVNSVNLISLVMALADDLFYTSSKKFWFICLEFGLPEKNNSVYLMICNDLRVQDYFWISL